MRWSIPVAICVMVLAALAVPAANAAELSIGCQELNDPKWDGQYDGGGAGPISKGEIVTVTAGPPDNVQATDPPMQVELQLYAVGVARTLFPGTVSMVASEPTQVKWELFGPYGGISGPSVATWNVSCDLAHKPNDLVGLVDTTTGEWHLRVKPILWESFYFGNPGDYPIAGDWNCDGVDTPGLYRQSDGYVYLRNSNTQGIADIRFFFGNPGDFPLAGDFNGDGCDTVSIYRPSEARIFIINELGSNDGGLGAADFDFYFGNPGDKPFVADFDGDGIDTIGLHRESTGFVYYRNSLTTGVAEKEFFYGDPGDQIISGYWKGSNTDGADTVGIYRPSNGWYYLRWTNTQGNADEVVAGTSMLGLPSYDNTIAVSGAFEVPPPPPNPNP